jgi:lambda family phage portal protein
MFGFGKSSSEKLLEAVSPSHLSSAPSDTVQHSNAVTVAQDVMVTASGSADWYPSGDGWGYGYHNGEKFSAETGFGGNTYLFLDYWALRAKSSELFERNPYARGVLRRWVTNVVATGLSLEAMPSESVLGMDEGALDEWSDQVEDIWELWANDPKMCDFEGRRTFGELQAEADREAAVTGDVLVIMRMHPTLKVPQMQLVDGSLVQTPVDYIPGNGNLIEWGVELDAARRHVAYWVLQEDGSTKRVPTMGSRSGRRLAWLHYANDKRMRQVRGQPFLSLMLQSTKELDRYRESAQRKATINSMIAAFVTKDSQGPGTRPLSGGAARRSTRVDGSEGAQGPISFQTMAMNPGLVIDRLAVGEKIQPFPTGGADQNYSDFEAGIVQTMAWSQEIPPEILTLSFNANYSASQAALNEFAMVLAVQRERVAQGLCQPFYREWLVSEVLQERLEARGLLEAWRDKTGPGRYTLNAWCMAEWTGHIKPTTDLFKQMRGTEMALAMGLVDYDRASRNTTGTKWRKNIRKQRRQREIAEEAGVPLAVGSGAPESAEEEEQNIGGGTRVGQTDEDRPE